MTGSRRILVFQDSEAFGGHEKAFLMWLPALLAADEVSGVAISLPAVNEAFSEALRPFGHAKLETRRSPFVKRGAEPLRAPFRLGYRAHVLKEIAAVAPDIVLLLQGRIENDMVPLLAAPDDVDVVSYIPMAHSAREMGRGAVEAAVMDRIKRLYYRLPQRYIVPSASVAGQLRRAGARGETHIVPNVVYPAPPAVQRKDARALLGLPAERPVATFIGRFDTAQKGLDRLARAIETEAADLGAWTFLFIGDGPGEDVLRGVKARCSGLDIRIQGWSPQPAAVISASDVVLMPSRFEGVPLIMLECLTLGTPLLASPLDVFREHLPETSLFDFEGPGLAAALARASAESAVAAFTGKGRHLLAGLSVERSGRLFVNGVLGGAQS